MSYLTIEDTFPIIQNYGVSDKDLFQGGLYSGNTFKRLIEGAESVGKPFRRKFAADSFQGLPEDTPGLWKNPDWPPGAFNICEDRGLKSIPDAIKYVSEYVNTDNVAYIPGFFKDSLNDSLAGLIDEEQISYLDVDVDIHSSSLELLKFAFGYNLLCEGAILRFDDYDSTPNNAGQRLAWSQTIHKYKVRYFPMGNNVFQVINHG